MHRHGFGLSLRSYGPEVVTHIHDHHQTVFAIAGRLEQRIGGAAGILTHAQWAVIRPGESHSFRATGPTASSCSIRTGRSAPPGRRSACSTQS